MVTEKDQWKWRQTDKGKQRQTDRQTDLKIKRDN